MSEQGRLQKRLQIIGILRIGGKALLQRVTLLQKSVQTVVEGIIE
jgi:hypothetical protein